MSEEELRLEDEYGHSTKRPHATTIPGADASNRAKRHQSYVSDGDKVESVEDTVLPAGKDGDLVVHDFPALIADGQTVRTGRRRTASENIAPGLPTNAHNDPFEDGTA